MEVVKFEPERIVPMPRWFAILVQTFFVAFAALAGSFLNMNYLLGLEMFFDDVRQNVVFYAMSFLVYKLISSPTVLDRILINFDNKEITFDYWICHVYKKQKVIKFQDFSFKITQDIRIFGGSESIRIYQFDKQKIKLNPSDGWKRTQLKSIYSLFLSIKKARIKRYWKW